MNPAQKSKLVDIITEYLAQFDEATKDTPKMVGVLRVPIGLQGFRRAEVGTPVFDGGDRYMVIMETLDSKSCHSLSYYKESLKSSIEFNKLL